MILADKIVELRKQNNWSQEELAGKLGVSRQAVSRWEGAQSTPDLERIIEMSKIFGVSTDYLLIDDIEIEASNPEIEEPGIASRRLSMEEANEFLSVKIKSAKPIAFGVWLCIMAIIPMILSEIWENQSFAESIGFIIAALFVAGAVALFILNGFKLEKFQWIEEDPFETAYGVDGMVKERLQSFMPTFITHIVIGVVLCILTLIVFVASGFLPTILNIPEDVVIALGFVIVAIAVYMFVKVGIVKGAYEMLLEVVDYHPHENTTKQRAEPIANIYWTLILAIYLIYSFYTANWGKSWIIWPIAGISYAVIFSIIKVIYKNKDNKENS